MSDSEKKDDEKEECLTPVASPYGKIKSSRSIRATVECPLCKEKGLLTSSPDPRAEPCEVCGGDRYTNSEGKITKWKVAYEFILGKRQNKPVE